MVQYQASYPYPVLGHEDDVNSRWGFRMNPTVALSTEDAVIRFRILCDDPDLRNMISRQEAKIVAEWQCSSTLNYGLCKLRITRNHPDGWEYETVIDQRDIRGQVEFSVYAVALRDFPHMSWKRQHPDYDGLTFPVEKGDYLAAPRQFVFSADKVWDPLNPPANSCIHIVKGQKSQKASCELDLAGESIRIKVSETVYDWLSMTGDNQLEMSLIVLPALVEAIDSIRNDTNNEYQDTEWARTLNNYLQNEDKDQRSITLAQRILRDPVMQYISYEQQQGED